jgi:hypothetical protein
MKYSKSQAKEFVQNYPINKQNRTNQLFKKLKAESKFISKGEEEGEERPRD